MVELTSLITQSARGDEHASDELYQMLYSDLKCAAHRIRFNWNNAETLNTTALVHESYIKVLKSDQLSHMNKLHFYHLCGRTMRYGVNSYLKMMNSDIVNDGCGVRILLGDPNTNTRKCPVRRSR